MAALAEPARVEYTSFAIPHGMSYKRSFDRITTTLEPNIHVCARTVDVYTSHVFWVCADETATLVYSGSYQGRFLFYVLALNNN